MLIFKKFPKKLFVCKMKFKWKNIKEKLCKVWFVSPVIHSSKRSKFYIWNWNKIIPSSFCKQMYIGHLEQYTKLSIEHTMHVTCITKFGLVMNSVRTNISNIFWNHWFFPLVCVGDNVRFFGLRGVALTDVFPTNNKASDTLFINCSRLCWFFFGNCNSSLYLL